MWVAGSDLPYGAGHPFYERLNRVLDEAGFDALVEEQCAKFNAEGVGRPSLAPGRYFWMLRLMEAHPAAAVERTVTAALKRHSLRRETPS